MRTSCPAIRISSTTVIAILIALHLGQCSLFAAVGQPPLIGDAADYWFSGRRIVAGDWLMVKDGIELVRTPGYPYIVAAVQLAFERYALVALAVLQQLMVFATALITAAICTRVSGSRWGGALGLLLGLFCISRHGIALYLLSDTFFCLLLTLVVAALVAWQQRPSAWTAIAIGLMLGLATLVRPIAQFAALPLLAAMMLQRLRGAAWPQLLRHAAWLLLAVAAVIAPWFARNYYYTGQLFLSQAGGLVMWQSLFKGSTSDRLNPAMPFADTPNTRAVLARLEGVDLQKHHDVYRSLETQGLSGIEINTIMQSVCVEAIRANPWKFLDTRVRRLGWFWITPNGARRPVTTSFHMFQVRPPEDTAPEEPQGIYDHAAHWCWDGYYRRGAYNWFWYNNAWIYLFAALLSGCGLLAMACRPSQRPIAVALAMLLFYFAAMTVIGAPPEYRYRMVLEPILIVIVTQLLFEPAKAVLAKVCP